MKLTVSFEPIRYHNLLVFATKIRKNLKIELFLSMGLRHVDFEAPSFKGKYWLGIIVRAAECNSASIHMLSVVPFLDEIVRMNAHDGYYYII